MKQSHAEFEQALAAAIGDEPALALDLAGAFREGVLAYRDAMAAARDARSWTAAAARIEGLAASFCARDLMVAAAAARIAVPGDPAILARIDAGIAATGVGHPD